jgi:PIN domain nuclease of toxin-antitoxin system
VTGVVADTHSLIWYLLDDSRLSQRAATAFDEATAAGRMIYLPTICLVEAPYLVEKHRIAEEAFSMLEQVLAADNSPIQPIGLNLDVAKAVRKIPRDSVPDLPDRVIAATALARGLPLVTRDGKIRASDVETIW